MRRTTWSNGVTNVSLKQKEGWESKESKKEIGHWWINGYGGFLRKEIHYSTPQYHKNMGYTLMSGTMLHIPTFIGLFFGKTYVNYIPFSFHIPGLYLVMVISLSFRRILGGGIQISQLYTLGYFVSHPKKKRLKFFPTPLMAYLGI